MRNESRRAEQGGFLADVALVVSDLRRGGTQRVVVTLANAWAAAGLRVGLITQALPDSDAFELDKAVHRISLGGTRESRSVSEGLIANAKRILALRRALKQLRARCIVSFIIHPNVLTILASLGLPGRVVISERNDPTRQRFPKVWEILRRVFYQRADLVTANTVGALEWLRAYVPEAKLVLVPNPLPCLDRSSEPLASSATEGPTIVAVGRLHPQKGYDILLEAFARFRRTAANGADWRLVILGDGELRDRLLEQSQALCLERAVDWKGLVADPYPCYRSADIFVLASRYEGSPNALLEAMSFGLAAVVTDASPGPLELVEDGVSGLVVPSEDPSALAHALARLAENTELRERLGAAARRRVAANALDEVLPLWNRMLHLPPSCDIKSLGSAKR